MSTINFEHIKLGHFPTPLHKLENLTRLLNGPDIYIKREDCAGLAMGGNKVRKLEYIMSDVIKNKADVIITIGAVSSNHARQTAAASSLLGLECQLVLMGHMPAEKQGNYLLDHILGAQTFCVKPADVEKTIQEIIIENKQKGKKSYVIPAGGHNIQGIMAYMECYHEIKEQTPVHFDAIITAVGTGTTYAGLQLGKKYIKDSSKILGISVGGDNSFCNSEILKVCNEMEHYLNISHSQNDDFNIFTDYIGEGYTKPYPQLRDIIKLLARTEGILLDPVYSGKAMVGLLDLIDKGYFRKEQNVLFLHTGGAPEIFSYNHFLQK